MQAGSSKKFNAFHVSHRQIIAKCQGLSKLRCSISLEKNKVPSIYHHDIEKQCLFYGCPSTYLKNQPSAHIFLSLLKTFLLFPIRIGLTFRPWHNINWVCSHFYWLWDLNKCMPNASKYILCVCVISKSTPFRCDCWHDLVSFWFMFT